MMTNKIERELSPIQELKRERGKLARECAAQEKQLEERWNYMRGNLGSLVLQSAANSALIKIGLRSKKIKEPVDGEEATGESMSTKLLNGFLASAPMLWELAQPLLLGIVAKRIKGIFSKSKK